MGIPLSSSNSGPFDYILNPAQLPKFIAADFVSMRFSMYYPYYLHLGSSEKLLSISCLVDIMKIIQVKRLAIKCNIKFILDKRRTCAVDGYGLPSVYHIHAGC
jgi:hypothetical protein